MRRTLFLLGIATLLVFGTTSLEIAAQRGGQAGPPPTPRAGAAIDLTGTWVPLITEDWRHRMVTPRKGDYESVPLNPAGRRAADTWDPAKDEAAGEQCRGYGAPAVMRMAGRIRISWDNDNTLKVETEAGNQTRLFLFGNPQTPAGTPAWQGYSVARWDETVGGRGRPTAGTLKVTTNRLRPGYLRKNGVPYSANTVLTEWYDRVTSPNGDNWLIVTTEVVDPQYLNQPFITSTHFKKLPDGSTFNPEPCSAR
jgi:hypothetical protein